MDFDDCPCSGKTMARLVQPAVMAIVAEECLHGYVIVQRLAALRLFRAQAPDPTGVYRILKSMEQDGYLKSSWEIEDGPARRCFAITAKGRKCLKHWVSTLEEYQTSVSELLYLTTRVSKAGGRKTRPRSLKCPPGSNCCTNVSPK